MDRHCRTQTTLRLWDLYPYRTDGLCRCGCGRPLTGRRTVWASDECQNSAVRRYRIIKGDMQEIRRALQERDQGVCQSCGARNCAWEAHHRVPVSKGGGACDLDNLVTLCLQCHRRAHGSDGRPALPTVRRASLFPAKEDA